MLTEHGHCVIDGGGREIFLNGHHPSCFSIGTGHQAAPGSVLAQA
jgi:hypothetical protein